MIHEFLRGHGCWKSLSGWFCTGACTPDCCLRTGGFLLPSLSGSLSGVCASFLSPAILLNSKAVPGVFGVLVAEAAPKDAKAPFPRANAEEPVAVVGEETDEVEMCPMG